MLIFYQIFYVKTIKKFENEHYINENVFKQTQIGLENVENRTIYFYNFIIKEDKKL